MFQLGKFNLGSIMLGIHKKMQTVPFTTVAKYLLLQEQ